MLTSYELRACCHGSALMWISPAANDPCIHLQLRKPAYTAITYLRLPPTKAVSGSGAGILIDKCSGQYYILTGQSMLMLSYHRTDVGMISGKAGLFGVTTCAKHSKGKTQP